MLAFAGFLLVQGQTNWRGGGFSLCFECIGVVRTVCVTSMDILDTVTDYDERTGHRGYKRLYNTREVPMQSILHRSVSQLRRTDKAPKREPRGGSTPRYHSL